MEKIVLEQATMLVSLSCGAFNPSTWAEVFLHELIALKVKARDFDFLKDLDFRAIRKMQGIPVTSRSIEINFTFGWIIRFLALNSSDQDP